MGLILSKQNSALTRGTRFMPLPLHQPSPREFCTPLLRHLARVRRCCWCCVRLPARYGQNGNGQRIVHHKFSAKSSMQRIILIGSGGAGKSTLAQRLGERLNIPVIHLDAYFWNPGWVETPRPEWEKKLVELLKDQSWVMDGNYGNTIAMRAPHADTIIFLDFSRYRCLWRALKRIIHYYGKTRPDMGPDCPERFDLEFLTWIWNFPKQSRPRLLEMIKKHGTGKQVLIFRKPNEVRKFLDGVR